MTISIDIRRNAPEHNASGKFRHPAIQTYECELAKLRNVEMHLRGALAQAVTMLREKDRQIREKDAMIRQQKALSDTIVEHDEAVRRVSSLTPRQRQIMVLILAGQPNKIIAVDLGISQRTVENHRASIMRKTASPSLPALARFGLAVGCTAGSTPRGRAAANPAPFDNHRTLTAQLLASAGMSELSL